MPIIKIAVLVSGRGSNLQAIIDSIESGKLPAKMLCVISDKPGAFGLERAKKHGIEAITLDYKEFPDKDGYEKELLKVLKDKNPDLICLAGYMKIVGKGLISAFKNKIINIHPALLPLFPGLNSQKQALDGGAKVSGCTVHFVDEGCDTGPIILQRSVPILDNDTEETLSTRILEQEHIAYPEAIRLIAEGRVHVEGEKVKISKEGK